MDDLVARRRVPFAAATAVAVVVTVAVFRLPEAFVDRLRRGGLEEPAAGWAFRLLALAAVAQGLYAGFVTLRPERLDPAGDRERLLRAVAGTAVTAALLTLVYGVASLLVTGLRAGFWLFVVVFVSQLAWYYRQTGQIARWLGLQPEPEPPARGRLPWVAAPPGYSPPLARSLHLRG